MTVIVDPEFAALIPPLTREEDLALTGSIRREGCRDPLIVWRTSEGDILLDGHNRYRICTFDKLPYRVTPAAKVQSRDEAVAWMIDNQLGRRNLTPDQASFLRGQRYNRSKVIAPFKGNQHSGVPQNEGHQRPTARRLAEQFKVSRATIERDGEFAAAVDTLAETVGPEVRQAILSGDSPLPKQDVVALADAEPEDQRRVLAFRSEQDMLAAAKEVREARAAERRQARENAAILEENLNDQEKAARADYARWKKDTELGRVIARLHLLSSVPPSRAAELTLQFGLHAIFVQNTKDMADTAIAWLREYSDLLGRELGTPPPTTVRRLK